jgi:hypothetical protein
MDFPQKAFGSVFEIPLLRNAHKRHKRTKKQKKKGTDSKLIPSFQSAPASPFELAPQKLKTRSGPYLVAICQIYVAFNFQLIVSSAPLAAPFH